MCHVDVSIMDRSTVGALPDSDAECPQSTRLRTTTTVRAHNTRPCFVDFAVDHFTSLEAIRPNNRPKVELRDWTVVFLNARDGFALF
jgi:hypothetical protein